MSIELKIPEVGESITEATIGKWLKEEGDAVEKDETLAELETDKVTVELPAPASGTLAKIMKKKGETAKVGQVIAMLEEGEGKAQKKKPASEREDAAEEKGKEDEKEPARKAKSAVPAVAGGPEEIRPRPSARVEELPHVMPAARRELVERGLDAGEVKGTGPAGRILKEDVQRAAVGGEAEDREAPAESAGAAAGESARLAGAPPDGDRQEEVVDMSPIRRRIAQRLVEAQHQAALLTTFNEVDMSRVMALRAQYKEAFEKRYQIKLGFMSFFVKAVVDALRLFPALNAEIRGGEKIAYRNYYDIGIAVSTQRGLVVPVIRSAQRLSFAEIEAAIHDFGQRAQNNRITLEDLQGGTFTITNGGVFGSLLSTPIVNPPQSGVLGMHAIQERPIASGGQVVIRPMMYVALTYDHRIVDGREAVTFLHRVKEAIEEPARMLLEV
ncbi:MAG: 2-oxoglutarate dehydrogenase complex dihydrolipoyllysine-residue succinyltransferase [Phycisphaeraceae bacterium]